MTPQPTHTPAEILEHTGWLRTLARQLVRDPHTADDVVQNTLMAALAWEGVPREGLRNWLAGVARNTARQMARGESRRKYRQAKAAAAEALPSTGEMVELVESQQFLAKAVLDLDEPYRTTIFLRFFDGLSPKEIAARQNIPASTVRVRLKRGLDVLRERLDGDAVGSDRHWSLLLLPLVMPSRSEVLAGAILAKGVAQFMGAAGAKALLLLSLVGSVLFVVYQSGTGANNAQEAIEAERLLSREGKIEDQGRSSAVNQREAQFVPTPQSTELTLVAEPGFLVGRVLGTQGETLAAARVTAVSANRRSPSILKFDAAPEWVGETTSDASGIYRIEVQSGHPYLIRAYYKDLAPRQTKAAYAGEVHDMLLDVGLNWTITLRDAVTREPLVEAEVNIQSLDAYRVPRAWGAEGKTDEDGQLVLSHLPPGAYKGTATGGGYAPIAFKGVIEQGHNAAREEQLSPAITVTGSVLDQESLEPVAGAQVRGPESTTTTDERGQFKLSGFDPLAPKAQGIVVRAAGHSPTARYVRVHTSESAPHVEIRLPSALRLVGRVVNELGIPLAGITVGHRGRFSPDPLRAERHDGETLTDANGNFELTLHYRAQYTIGAEAPGLPTAHLWVRNVNPKHRLRDIGDLVLREAGAIHGVVQGRELNRETPDTINVDLLHQGGFQAGPSLLVQVVPVSPSGEFHVEGLAPGNYGLTLQGAAADGGQRTKVLVREVVRVLPGKAVRDLELTAADPIEGQVACPKGVTGSRIQVRVHRTLDTPALATTQADIDGFFVLVPAGPGPFIVVAEDAALLASPASAERVMAGDKNLSLILKPRDTQLSIDGVLLDEQGKPVIGAFIRIVAQKSRDILGRETLSTNDGSFRVGNLNDELYTVHAFTSEAQYELASRFDVRPGGKRVELQMNRKP